MIVWLKKNTWFVLSGLTESSPLQTLQSPSNLTSSSFKPYLLLLQTLPPSPSNRTPFSFKSYPLLFQILPHSLSNRTLKLLLQYSSILTPFSMPNLTPNSFKPSTLLHQPRHLSFQTFPPSSSWISIVFQWNTNFLLRLQIKLQIFPLKSWIWWIIDLKY